MAISKFQSDLFIEKRGSWGWAGCPPSLLTLKRELELQILNQMRLL